MFRVVLSLLMRLLCFDLTSVTPPSPPSSLPSPPFLPPLPSPSIIHSSHSCVRHTRLYSCVIESIFYSRLQIICSYFIVYSKYTNTLILASILEGNIVQPGLFFFHWTHNATIVPYSSPIHLNIYSRVSEPASGWSQSQKIAKFRLRLRPHYRARRIK